MDANNQSSSNSSSLLIRYPSDVSMCVWVRVLDGWVDAPSGGNGSSVIVMRVPNSQVGIVIGRGIYI
jgi:hypothetical protein